jgi:hypothetical protein
MTPLDLSPMNFGNTERQPHAPSGAAAHRPIPPRPRAEPDRATHLPAFSPDESHRALSRELDAVITSVSTAAAECEMLADLLEARKARAGQARWDERRPESP